VIFRDASNAWWRRHLAEAVEAVHADPDNQAYTPAERAQFDENARSLLGRDPHPHARITCRVRWHRRWRQLHGKSPTP
jgi:hypothetical protein